MPEAEAVPNSVAILMGSTIMLSLAALAYLFQKHIDGRPLLTYRPRLRVPWGPGVAMFAMAMPLFGVLLFLTGVPGAVQEDQAVKVVDEIADEIRDDNAQIENAQTDETDIATDNETDESEDAPEADSPKADAPATKLAPMAGWGDFAFMIVFVVVVGGWIALFYGADGHDFGLPTSMGEAARDFGLGCFAAIAAMVPIYVVQLTLILTLQINTKHPLVEQVEQDQGHATLLLAFAMAVIAAPLFEEFIFRCLLQGWLEKREDEVLGFAATRREVPEETPFDQAPVDFTDENPALESQEFSPIDRLPEEATLEASKQRPPVGWNPALPHGWTPIVISGVLFGLAHLGHGVAPISLMLFGMVLGYLYQRTHRLLPCIAAHMLFNSYSMVQLWLHLKPGG